MNPPADAITDRKVEVAKAFAQNFTHFEWKYLCSYQWFLTGMDHALETGNFSQLAARADKTLVDDRIRQCSKTNKESKRVASWQR